MSRIGIPLLLLTIVSLQRYHVHQNDLTPWKGGGFGMFSTIDGVPTRFIEAYVKVNGEMRHIKMPKKFKNMIFKAKAFPTEENLNGLLNAISLSPEISGRPVKLQFFKTNFNSQTHVLKKILIRELEANGPKN